MSPNPRAVGFTLLELLVVIVMLALLASLVGPAIFGNVGDARMTTARSQIELLGLALDSYRLDMGSYPPSEPGLTSLRIRPVDESTSRAWRGPYLRKDVPLDPWNRPYVYRAPGEHNPHGYDLLTLGRDGQPGGQGEDADIASW